MGLFNIFKKKLPEPVYIENEAEIAALIAEFEEKRDLIIGEFKEKTTLQSIRLTAKRGKTALTDSKFGGKPYFPKNLEYPRNKNGQPLFLLAQLNFSNLPKLDKFPQKGILQFFIEAEDFFGLGFDDYPIGGDGFRVIYHENILSGGEINNDVPEYKGEKFPFTGEFALTAEYEPCPMTIDDFRFDDQFMGIYKKHINTEADSIIELDDYISEELNEEFDFAGHRIGGYPHFTQYDPREQPYSIMLFQMDSDNGISWGDAGVAGFFISPEDLARLDFSNVLYHWDCC